MVYVTDQGIYLDAMDGSAPILLVANPDTLGSPVWSPDSQWIGLTYWESVFGAEPSSPTPHLALLHPDTCEFIVVGPQPGLLFSWVP
jgi:hypothetical protein